MQVFPTPTAPLAIKNPDGLVGEHYKADYRQGKGKQNNSKAHSPNRVSLLHKGGKSYMTQRVR